MKSLYIVRHAKSSWDNIDISDFDRPLNERGKRDAPEMAKRIKNKGVSLDAFFSSPAKRAKKTAKIFAEEFGFSKKDINLVEELYHADPPVFYKVIASIPRKFQHVAIFSHNPGITDFVNELTNTRVDNVPTCGIFAVKVSVEKWEDFKDGKKELLFFEFPKDGSE